MQISSFHDEILYRFTEKTVKNRGQLLKTFIAWSVAFDYVEKAVILAQIPNQNTFIGRRYSVSKQMDSTTYQAASPGSPVYLVVCGQPCGHTIREGLRRWSAPGSRCTRVLPHCSSFWSRLSVNAYVTKHAGRNSVLSVPQCGAVDSRLGTSWATQTHLKLLSQEFFWSCHIGTAMVYIVGGLWRGPVCQTGNF